MLHYGRGRKCFSGKGGGGGGGGHFIPKRREGAEHGLPKKTGKEGGDEGGGIFTPGVA